MIALAAFALAIGSAGCNAKKTYPATVEGSAKLIKVYLQDVGSPATLTGNSAFIEREIVGHRYWVAKAFMNNWTVGGTNYGSLVVGVVISPEDKSADGEKVFFRFMTIEDFNVFLKTGNRDLLQIPDLNVTEGECATTL